MKKFLLCAVAVALGAVFCFGESFVALPAKIFIGGEVVPHWFQSGDGWYSKGIPYLTFGGIYPMAFTDSAGDAHKLRFTVTGQMDNPLVLKGWYGASVAGSICLSPEIVWVGAGVATWLKFEKAEFPTASWALFGELRFVWNEFVNAYIRLHLPQRGVSETAALLGGWVGGGISIEFGG